MAGLRDEAVIQGRSVTSEHSGSSHTAGRILQALSQLRTSNPVILLEGVFNAVI